MMADSPASNTGPAMAGVPAGTVGGGGGGGGPHDPTVIPQWKKELIQRRKNLAKTIGAVATQVHDSASTVAAAISASASSPVTAHPRTPTGSGAFPVGSPFYAGSGTKDTTTCAQADATTVTASETLHQLSGGAEQPVAAESSGQLAENGGNNNDFTSCSISDHATATTTASPTSPGGAFAGVHYGAANEHLQQQQHYHHSQQHHHQQQQQQRGGVGSATRGPAEAVAVLVPPSTAPASGSSPSSLPTANGAHSHSNATTQHSSEQSGSSAAIGSATQHRTTGGTVIVERESSSVCSSAAVVGGKVVSGTHSPTQQQQQQQQQHTSRDGVAARKMVAATAAEEIVVVYEKSSVLGGLDVTGGGGGGIVGGGGVGGGGGGGGIGDAGEELKYGPGIVSRLRCRYLSLALRQSVAKQRPSLNSMRRATSLNNLLDEESEDLSEREQSIGSEGTGGGGVGVGPGAGHHHHHHHQQQQQQQQKKYQSQNYHHQHQHQHHQQQQQQQYHREHYTNGNGNNHNHNHNHHQQQQQQQIHPTVVLQAPPYLKQQQQQHQFAPKQQPWVQQQHQQQLQHQEEQQPGGGAVKTAPFLRGVQNSYTRASRQVEKKNEYNRYTKHHRGAGGADAILLKRARSVEALVRYDHKAWERDAANPVASAATTATTAPPAPVAVAPATIATVPSTTITTVSSSVEVGSNVIILDEIAQPTTATTTTTVTATPPAAVAAAVVTAHLNEGHVTSNGISSSNLITTTGSPTTSTATTTTTAAMLLNGKGATGAGGAPDLPLLVSDCVTIEEKIINGREKGDPKPKRLTSFIDADERPPPDVVKQTMKIFEANANRRGGRPTAGTGGGVVTSVATTAVATANAAGSEVAHKVASYRSIIISGTVTTPPGVTTTAAAAAAAAIAGEKPPITHPKPPLSPKKPNIKPRTASPKQQQQVVSAAAGKPPPTPKTLEAVNNLKNVALTPSSSSPPPVVAVKNHNKPPTVGMTEAPNQQQQQYQQQATPPSPPARSKHTTPVVANGANGGSGVGTKGLQSDALKNGATIRDHNNYENGTTQTPSTGAKTLSSTTTTTTTATTLATPGSDYQHMHTSGTGNTAREAATSPTTTTTGICDSPSIQQLTGKLASLHLATSTPTGAANGSVLVQDRRNLDYVTSEEDDTTTAEEEEEDEDEEVRDKVDHGKAGGITGASGSYTVNPDSSEEGEDVPAVGGGSEHDADGEDEVSPDSSEEEEDEEHRSVRKISRTAMENIARAGTTTQFRFNGAVKSSYLPGASGAGGGGGGMTPVASNKPPAPPIPMSRESLTGGGVGKPPQIEANGRLPPEGASVVTSSNSNGVSSGSSSALSAASVASGGSSAIVPGGALIPTAVPVPVPSLTRREIEKNQINREKSGESVAVPVSSGTNNANGAGSGVQVASANNGSGGGANGAGVKPTMAPTTAIDSTTSFVAKWGTGGSAGTVVSGQSPLAGLVPVRKKTKPPPSHQQDGTNTMVFNFSDRKDVPDYIENDGVIIRPRPRELPKPGESGFVVLGDLTLETSTDPDDAWATGPPSPCNGEFANAYIVINGKSSMRNKTSRSSKFKIQFDDSLTSTYEYPSETSLLEANGYDDADTGTDANGATGLAFADNGLLSHTNKLLSSVPLGSAPFASYTPVKAAIDTTFELGVTRTPSPSAASTASSTGSNGSLTTSSNSSNHSQHSATSATSTHSEQKAQLQHSTVSSNGHHHHQLQQHQLDRPNNNGLHSNGHSNGDAMLNGEPLLGSSGTGEPESIQYLKPASDEQTVNWSQGTRVTDLLF